MTSSTTDKSDAIISNNFFALLCSSRLSLHAYMGSTERTESQNECPRGHIFSFSSLPPVRLQWRVRMESVWYGNWPLVLSFLFPFDTFEDKNHPWNTPNWSVCPSGVAGPFAHMRMCTGKSGRKKEKLSFPPLSFAAFANEKEESILFSLFPPLLLSSLIRILLRCAPAKPLRSLSLSFQGKTAWVRFFSREKRGASREMDGDGISSPCCYYILTDSKTNNNSGFTCAFVMPFFPTLRFWEEEGLDG